MGIALRKASEDNYLSDLSPFLSFDSFKDGIHGFLLRIPDESTGV